MKRLRNFWAKVSPEPNSGCWLWDGMVNPVTGYGMFRMSPDPTKALAGAHRAAWMLLRGEIPRGMQICHKCDVRTCVNPDHLFVGTAKDNMRDASRKGKMTGNPWGRRRKGESNPSAVLSAEQVHAIRESTETGVSLAKKHGVSPVTVSRIRRNLAWRHLSQHLQ